MSVATIRLSLLTLLYGIVAAPVAAKCNNDNISTPPSADVKVFIGYEHPNQVPLDGLVNGQRDHPRSAPLPSDMLTKSGTGEFSKEGRTEVSYYENDGSGSWRVCRIEYWWPGKYGSEETRAARTKLAQEYRKKSSTLEKLPTDATVSGLKMIFYDKQGRLERFSSGNIESGKSAVDDACLRYDAQDRVLLAVYPRVTKVCPKGEPDRRDGWKRFKYGEADGQTVRLVVSSHAGNEDGSWSEETEFRTRPGEQGVGGHAKVDSINGVTQIYGSNVGKLDNNSANMVVNEFGQWSGSTYTFTKPPVPVEVLDNPDLIYKYDRRRQTILDTGKLYEFFPANSHKSRDRYYMLDSFVLRHEQLNAAGKVTRVITLKDWRQPRPGPNPDVDDKKLIAKQFPLLHEVFHRVYDIDAKGTPKLVAISWNRERRLNPAKRVPLDMADLVYGTPDGKARWKQAEFEKIFNTSAHANSVFPDNPRTE